MKKTFAVLYLLISIALLTGCMTPTTSKNVSEYEKKTKNMFKEVEKEVEEIRGLEVPESTQIKVVNQTWVLERWGVNPSKTPSQFLVDKGTIYRALLLIPADYQYSQARNAQVSSFMAFTWKGNVYVVKENFEPAKASSREAVAHELEHILQERYFSTTKRTKFDGQKSNGAVIEGSAILVGKKYRKTLKEVEMNPEIYRGRERVEEVKALSSGTRGQPVSLKKLSGFVYRDGEKYITHVYSEGGWNAVDKEIENPPETTQKILHPEKEDSFRKMETDLEVENWRKIRSNRFGEFFVRVFLDTHIGEIEAKQASEGWDGDNFVIYGNKTSHIFEWKIAWENEKDTDEFEDALKTLLKNNGEKEKGYWKVRNQYIDFYRNNTVVTIIGSTERAKLLNNT